MTVDLEQAIAILKDGGVIGIPTDTVYGFACLPEFSDKIYALKKREKNKPLILMIDSIAYFTDLDPAIKTLMLDKWPGATTIIFPYENKLTSFRIPNEKNLLTLLKTLNMAIVSTSANVSGAPACLSRAEFEMQFPKIGLLAEKYPTSKSGTPSTILLYNNGIVEKLR